ncbi:MAG: Crp/Fnr family transcriptional regulator [Christensenellales bacterium]
MNEREVQAFLSGLPKHVPQRTAKFRAGQIISDSMHGLSGVGVVENGRVDIYAVALDGRDVQPNSIGAGSASASATCWWRAAANRSALRRETTVRFGKRKRWLRRCAATRRWRCYAALCNAKIQFLLSRIEMLTMQSCRGKVLAFLLAEKREDGVILLRGTRDELASRLSVSRAALYRELSALQSGGYLEVGESRLRVLNTSALEKLLYGV